MPIFCLDKMDITSIFICINPQMELFSFSFLFQAMDPQMSVLGQNNHCQSLAFSTVFKLPSFCPLADSEIEPHLPCPFVLTIALRVFDLKSLYACLYLCHP